MTPPFEPVDERRGNVPPAVVAAAKGLLAAALADPCAPRGPAVVSAWTLEAHAVEYVCPPGRRTDVVSRVVERAARDELLWRLEDLADDPDVYYATLMLGDPAEGAVVLARVPDEWWIVEPLERLRAEGVLRDMTDKGDVCPSLGAELMDGTTLKVFVGHPHPDHHTRADGCDPRFIAYVYDAEAATPGEESPAWEGENENEAARQILRIMGEHGGPRRRLRAV